MEYYTSVENRGYLADPVELENARLQTYKLENEVDQCSAYLSNAECQMCLVNYSEVIKSY